MISRFRHLIFHKIIGRLFFLTQTRYTEGGAFRKIINLINQSVNENGLVMPWVYSKKECLDFWGAINNQSESSGNRPIKYAQKSTDTIEYLRNFWLPEINYEDSVLELGCNAGGNLSYLHELGYKKLNGIEINPVAIQQMLTSFPRLEKAVSISNTDV